MIKVLITENCPDNNGTFTLFTETNQTRFTFHSRGVLVHDVGLRVIPYGGTLVIEAARSVEEQNGFLAEVLADV